MQPICVQKQKSIYYGKNKKQTNEHGLYFMEDDTEGH